VDLVELLDRFVIADVGGEEINTCVNGASAGYILAAFHFHIRAASHN